MSSAKDDDPVNKYPGIRQVVLSSLTTVSHVSSAFIGTFLLIHLAAPVAANFGGSSAASQMMLLGREYYQTPRGEKLLVQAPLLVHVVSSVARRLLSPPKSRRRLRSTLSWTAYGTLLFFLPVHYISHRIVPSDPSPPIFGVGPSELDFEFVKIGLQQFPLRSWFLYAGLVALSTTHAAEGMFIIWNTRVKPWLGSVRKRTLKNIAALLSVPIVTGLFIVWREPLISLSSVAARFQAAYSKSPIFRL